MGWYLVLIYYSPKEIILGNSNALHVFSGIRHVPTIVTALKLVRKCKLKFAIMHEPRVFEGFKGWLRFFQSWLTESWLRRNTSFVLAIGRNGPPWFTMVGYNKVKVFPFAYFINTPKLDAALARGKSSIIKIAYVGRLVPEKGVEYLLRALAQIPNHHLTIVGDGENKPALQSLTKKMNLNVEFVGVLPMQQVPNLIVNADVLVLPSITKDDGWGVAVSEALLVGTVAVATDCVGSSIVLDEKLMGRVVPARDSNAIAEAILSLEKQGAFEYENRALRKQKAQKMLSAQAGADYFIKLVQQLEVGSINSKAFNHFQ